MILSCKKQDTLISLSLSLSLLGLSQMTHVTKGKKERIEERINREIDADIKIFFPTEQFCGQRRTLQLDCNLN